MPVNGNVAVTRSVLPDGIAGVDATVKKIVEMAHGIYGSKSAKVRALAIDIVKNANVPDKDYYGEIVAIHNWVRDNIRYFHDPIGQETLSYPEETLFNSRGGDCDDMVITEIALLGAIGVEAFPVVVGMFPGHYSHVYLHAKVPAGRGANAGKTIPLDPIMKDWPAGKEASQGIKAKKTYPNLANPLTMNGLPMNGLGNLKRQNHNASLAGMDVGDLGAYAIAPSYLDTEDSHADELLVSDRGSSITKNQTVANGTQVDMPFEGIDGMFGDAVSDENGNSFSATSAGDGGTIVQSGGQLVPKGFIRNGPDLQEIMAMNPATADQLGPRGPIFARKAGLNRDYLVGASDPKLASLARELQRDQSVRQGIVQNVGERQYTMPSVQAALRQQQGLSPVPTRMTPKQAVVVLNSIPLDRLNAEAKPLGSLGEQLAEAEAELAKTAPAAQIAMAKSRQPQAMHYAEGWKRAGKDLNNRVKALEDKILKLRQILRDKGIADPTNGVRANAVQRGQQSMDGMGDLGWGVSSVIKKVTGTLIKGSKKAVVSNAASNVNMMAKRAVQAHKSLLADQVSLAKKAVRTSKDLASLAAKKAAAAKAEAEHAAALDLLRRSPGVWSLSMSEKFIQAHVDAFKDAESIYKEVTNSPLGKAALWQLYVNMMAAEEAQRLAGQQPMQGLAGPTVMALPTVRDHAMRAQHDYRLNGGGAQALHAARDRRLVARGPTPVPMSGMGSVMDTVKQPIVWGPALAFVGVLAFMYLKKRRAAAATA